MNLFLIGYRATGKTSVGKALASVLKWDFIDADLMLVKKYGLTINEIVAKQGWDVFREMECQIIKQICLLDRHVVATGGGAVLNNENVKNMKKQGSLVWLKADPETIKKRIAEDEKTKDLRPALTDKGLIKEINEVLSARNPIYESSMNFCVDTDSLSINEVSNIILKKINRLNV